MQENDSTFLRDSDSGLEDNTATVWKRPSELVSAEHLALEWETTLDPNVRSLLQVTVNHADEEKNIFSTLMGDIVEPRRDFIQTNASKVVNLDV